jgi:hypothetical protein
MVSHLQNVNAMPLRTCADRTGRGKKTNDDKKFAKYLPHPHILSQFFADCTDMTVAFDIEHIANQPRCARNFSNGLANFNI